MWRMKGHNEETEDNRESRDYELPTKRCNLENIIALKKLYKHFSCGI